MNFTLNYFEIFIVVLSLSTAFFTIQQKAIRWPIDIILMILNLTIHYKMNLYDRWIFYGIIIIIDFYGWYNWLHGGKKRTELKVSKTSSKTLCIMLLVGLISTLVLYFPLSYLGSYLPFIGAARTVFSIIALWLASRKKLENWFLWIVLNFISIFIYFQKGLYFFSFKYFMYILLAIWGYSKWKKTMKQ